MIWLLLDPFLMTTPTMSGRMVYWMVHRALPPVAVGVLAIGYLMRIRKFPQLGLAELAMIGYVCASLFSIALYNKTPQSTAYLFYDRVVSPMFLYLIIRLSMPGEKELKQLVPAIFFLGVTQASIGILSWLAPQFLPQEWLRLEDQRTTGSLVTPSVFTSAMVFAGLLLLHSAFDRKPGLIRTIYLCVFSLSIFCIFISFSRASWLAGILVLLGLIYLYPKFMLRWALVVVPTAILIVGTLYVGYFYDPSERLNERDSALSRLPTVLAAYRMFEAKPVLGWGYGNFSYYDRPFQERVRDLVDARRDTASHNLYLTTLAEQGILGLTLFLTPVIWWLFETIRMKHQIPAEGFWNKKLLFLLWLVILNHLIVNNFSQMWIGFGYGMWWLTLGLIANLLTKNTANTLSDETYSSNPLPSGMHRRSQLIHQTFGKEARKYSMNNHSYYLNRPVFISGFHKSGTTLLLSLLDGHPQLVVFPEELHFFKNVLFERDKAKAIKEKTGFKMFLSNWDSQMWSQGVANFREGYPEFDSNKLNQLVEKAIQVHKSDKDLLLRLIKAFAVADHVDPAGKLHWVSKTPRDEMFFPVMRKMFGNDFKLVYIVRDPRDVYHSISKRKEIEGKQSIRNHKGLITFSVYWKTQINRVISYQKKHKNIGIFHFEDLLINTENTLRELCEFLQIDYSKELLQSTRHGKRWRGNSVFSKGFEGLSQEPIGRFREYMDPELRALLERFLSKELIALGYDDPDSLQAIQMNSYQLPWFDYWKFYLKIQRWYFFRQYYTAFRYSFSSFH